MGQGHIRRDGKIVDIGFQDGIIHNLELLRTDIASVVGIEQGNTDSIRFTDGAEQIEPEAC